MTRRRTTQPAPATPPSGELERALLAELWGRGAATARELHECIGEARGTVYTTTAKVLDRLVDKRVVERQLHGRAYTYKPLAKQAQTQRAMARSLIRELLGSDPQPAVAALLGAMEDVSPDLIEQLAAQLEARKAGR